ncbi:MAG: serine/threonine-protein kinase [Vicinamibacterales bacterium]|nr:serine/threonine-protein kinase [Vicinamibacterales bacterium]
MTTLRHCPQCNAELPSDAPDGVCPTCLVQQGFDSRAGAAGDEPGATGSASRPGFAAPPPEELSARFPQFDIVELVGQGGMGAVYKARQPTLDRFVALKILPPEVGDDPAFAERFKREARALAMLSHASIVTVHDFGEADGLYYFVMEYVDGTNLRQTIADGRLTPPEALAIVPQICDALQFAHDEGVVHRDIKPENVLIDTRGRVKITDFGLAKLLGAETDDTAIGKPFTLTGTRQVMGTAHYMAPEQMQGSSSVDHRADIYSLAARGRSTDSQIDG